MGYQLNKLSIQLEKIQSNRTKHSKEKLSLIPDKLCSDGSKYQVRDGRCICLDDNGEELRSDPANCSLSSSCGDKNKKQQAIITVAYNERRLKS